MVLRASCSATWPGGAAHGPAWPPQELRWRRAVGHRGAGLRLPGPDDQRADHAQRRHHGVRGSPRCAVLIIFNPALAAYIGLSSPSTIQSLHAAALPHSGMTHAKCGARVESHTSSGARNKVQLIEAAYRHSDTALAGAPEGAGDVHQPGRLHLCMDAGPGLPRQARRYVSRATVAAPSGMWEQLRSRLQHGALQQVATM